MATSKSHQNSGFKK